MKYKDDKYGFYNTIIGVNDIKTTNPLLDKQIISVYVNGHYSEEYSPYIRNDMHLDIICKCLKCKGEFQCTIDELLIDKNICPYCSNRKLLPGFNDITKTHAKLAKELSKINYEFKRNFNPKYIHKNYENDLWWTCPRCGESYTCSPSKRELNDRLCPYCGNKYKVITGVNDLATTHPLFAKEYSKHNKLKASEVSIDMRFNAEWNCPRCGNKYYLPISARKNDSTNQCPHCKIKKESLAASAPDLIKNEWCNEENLLMDLNPNIIKSNCWENAFWQCKNKHKKYKCIIAKKYNNYLSGEETCPVCKGLNGSSDKFL